jgi:hypothetical protein
MILLAKEDVEVHIHVVQTITEQFHLCEWRHCRLRKLFRLSEMTSTYLLAVIPPWREIMGPTEYGTTILLPKYSQNLPRISLLEPGISDCGLLCVFSKRKLFLMQWAVWRTTHVNVSHAPFQLPDVLVLLSWYHRDTSAIHRLQESLWFC